MSCARASGLLLNIFEGSRFGTSEVFTLIHPPTTQWESKDCPSIPNPEDVDTPPNFTYTLRAESIVARWGLFTYDIETHYTF